MRDLTTTLIRDRFITPPRSDQSEVAALRRQLANIRQVATDLARENRLIDGKELLAIVDSIAPPVKV